MVNCKIEISNENSSVDEEIRIKIIGLAPKQIIVIKAISDDYYCINEGIQNGLNNTWESYAKFISDENGIVDLLKHKPLDGAYNRADSMGLFYSMKIKEIKKVEISNSLSKIPINKNYHILIQVQLENKIICSKVIERYFSDETIQVEDINSPLFVGRYFTSKSKFKRPAIIVVSGSDGRIEKAQALAQIFSIKGYSALAIGYFDLTGISKELSQIPLEYIENAIKWLKEKETVDKEKIGIYGRSKGGEYALLSGSKFKDIKTVISVVPSIYVFEGMKSNKTPSHKSSWTYKEKNIPFLPFSKKTMIKYILRTITHKKNKLTLMYKELLENDENLEKAQIKLENINGKVLMISSKNDNIWPSGYFTEIAKETYGDKIERYDYENAGHMLILPHQSIQDENKLYSNIYDLQDCNILAWNNILAFLNKWKDE